MNDPRPLKVFLCHAHADRDPVRALYTRLTKDGVDITPFRVRVALQGKTPPRLGFRQAQPTRFGIGNSL